MNEQPIIVVAGQPKAYPIQCWAQGGVTPAIYNATDVLSGAVIQTRQVSPLFVPSVGWYTADSTQVGYLQGQVEPSFTTAQALLLIPTISYTLEVWRSLVGFPLNLDLIARRRLIIVPLAY